MAVFHLLPEEFYMVERGKIFLLRLFCYWKILSMQAYWKFGSEYTMVSSLQGHVPMLMNDTTAIYPSTNLCFESFETHYFMWTLILNWETLRHDNFFIHILPACPIGDVTPPLSLIYIKLLRNPFGCTYNRILEKLSPFVKVMKCTKMAECLFFLARSCNHVDRSV